MPRKDPGGVRSRMLTDSMLRRTSLPGSNVNRRTKPLMAYLSLGVVRRRHNGTPFTQPSLPEGGFQQLPLVLSGAYASAGVTETASGAQAKSIGRLVCG